MIVLGICRLHASVQGFLNTLLFRDDALRHVAVHRILCDKMLHEERFLLANTMASILCLRDDSRDPVELCEHDVRGNLKVYSEAGNLEGADEKLTFIIVPEFLGRCLTIFHWCSSIHVHRFIGEPIKYSSSNIVVVYEAHKFIFIFEKGFNGDADVRDLRQGKFMTNDGDFIEEEPLVELQRVDDLREIVIVNKIGRAHVRTPVTGK